MKTLTKITTGIIMLLNMSYANQLSYRLTASNFRYLSPSVMEFDIYLLDNSLEDETLIYFLGQYFFTFNTEVANGGTLELKLVSSALPEIMRPVKVTISYDQLRISTGNVCQDNKMLPAISKKDPGTLIATLRLETSAKEFSKEKLSLKWDSETFKTRIAVKVNDVPVEITKTENHFIISGDKIINNTEISPELPIYYSLSQNYPNPFNPETKIRYEIPKAGHVKLAIFDITGKEILTAVNELKSAGEYFFTFYGNNFASGIYFYKLSSEDFVQTKRMLLIK